MLVPPDNFSMVEEGIYRSSKLDAIHISFLKSLDLKSIIWVNEEKPPRSLRQFINDHNIRLFHMINSNVLPEEDEIINVKYQEWMVLKPSIISKTIEHLLDVNNQNCLLMDKSDVIVGVIRHIQRWNYTSISNEYILYANRSNYKAEIFLELINLELIPHPEDVAGSCAIEDDEDITYTDLENEISSVSSSFSENNSHMDQSTPHIHSGTSLGSFHEIDQHGSTNDIPRHSSSQAISIQRNNSGNKLSIFHHNNSNFSSIHNYNYNSNKLALGASSPSMRRLSIENRLETSGYGFKPSSSANISTSPLSNRLSISTSPQIPKNLLKMVEKRKQQHKKKQSTIINVDGNSDGEDRIGVTGDPTATDLPNEIQARGSFNGLSTSALNSYQLVNGSSKATASIAPVSTPALHASSSSDLLRGIAIGPTDTIASTHPQTTDESPSFEPSTSSHSLLSSKRPGSKQWKLYQPRPNGVQIKTPSDVHHQQLNINTCIRVQLPRDSALPEWFLRIRALCEQS